MSLGENFGREPMHPLDEAEAFAKLASNDGKDANAIAADFGVSERYVRQRMKLADLAEVVKTAHRAGEINTAIAEAFAAVPKEEQIQVWAATQGHLRHAEQVRNVIASVWIDAAHALFDVSALPESAVSQDLFSEKVLVERQVFMTAQLEALSVERAKLIDDGWKQVVAGSYDDLRDQMRSMDLLAPEFDKPTRAKLEKLDRQREKLEAKFQTIPEDDDPAVKAVQDKLQALETEVEAIVDRARTNWSEATKAVGTAFLMILPNGQVERDYYVPKRNARKAERVNSQASDGGAGLGPPTPPTSDDLNDWQLAVTFTHEALAVRAALLNNAAARKRVLALILHEKVRSEALSIRHEANGVTLHAGRDGFASQTFKRMEESCMKLDPFARQARVEDCAAYEQFGKLKPARLDDLIDLLTVECVTAHLQRQTDLIRHLASELKVDVRKDWRPDAGWLSGFQKIQLAHLIVELLGPVHEPAPERKKSDLVKQLDKLFTDAAEGQLEDKQLAQKINNWLPVNLRPEQTVDKSTPTKHC